MSGQTFASMSVKGHWYITKGIGTEQNEKYMKVVSLEGNQQPNDCLANSMVSNRLHFYLVLKNERNLASMKKGYL